MPTLSEVLGAKKIKEGQFNCSEHLFDILLQQPAGLELSIQFYCKKCLAVVEEKISLKYPSTK